jgi:DNA repair exonuclease SbcCD ATPase subunit
LSNLTKILIVLLTISVIFLCGIVVTYVANADNYKQKYASLNSERDSLEKDKESLDNQLKEKIQQKDDLEKSLNGQLATLKTSAADLQAKINTVERERAELLERVNGWASITKDFQATTEKQIQLLTTAQEDVKQLKGEQIKLSKELEQTSAALVEKTAIIEAAETEKRRLIVEKTDLQNQLDNTMKAGGKVAAAGTQVTQEKGYALPAQTTAAAINLKALISEVDAKNSLATISIGSADGVKEGMKFHVTRGSEFVCDVLIVDVDTDKAVGVLELVQPATGGPKVGDNASTNL